MKNNEHEFKLIIEDIPGYEFVVGHERVIQQLIENALAETDPAKKAHDLELCINQYQQYIVSLVEFLGKCANEINHKWVDICNGWKNWTKQYRERCSELTSMIVRDHEGLDEIILRFAEAAEEDPDRFILFIKQAASKIKENADNGAKN